MMTVIPIDKGDIAAARALRVDFARFWSTAQGKPEDIYDRFISNAAPLAQGVDVRTSVDDPGPGWWVSPPEARPDRAILYLHGGGYFVGHVPAYSGFVSQVVARAQAPAFVLEYPLSTEAVLPTALDLAVSVLARLASTFKHVSVMGDSAGGGLAFATVLEARRLGIPVSALVGFSPWLDLTLTSGSVLDLAISDPLLAPAYLRECAARYLGDAPATDPRASPFFSKELGSLPPTLMQVGSDEILLDDSRGMASKAAAAGVDVELEVWQGMHHVFQLNVDLASARKALDNAVGFLSRHWT